MFNIDQDMLLSVLDYPSVIESIRNTFRKDFQMPLRHHHFYNTEKGIENTLILMPSWTSEYMGIKQVVVAPDNVHQGLPTIHALYTILDSKSGEPLAIMDASLLTSIRTACTSALAADYLSGKNAETLLVVGTGKVARHLVQAHCSLRKYQRISIWGRSIVKAEQLAKALRDLGYHIEVATSLENAVIEADVISCATLSDTPLIKGEWLRKGQHLDLIGSYKPHTREADDTAIMRSSLFVDSRPGALHESGELGIPLKKKLISPSKIKADIIELCNGLHEGRTSDSEITLFKSVGLAIEDLATGLLAYHKLKSDCLE